MILRQQSVDPARTRHLLSGFVPALGQGCEHAPRECFPAARYSPSVWIGSAAGASHDD